MSRHLTRRHYLQTAVAGGTSVGFRGLEGFLGLSPATVAETRVTPDIVRFGDDIEGLVRLIENTPREKCVEMLVEQLRRGVAYRQFLSALFLAGLRNFKPAGTGGMHAVYVIHSAHQFSLDARPEERLLPLFFALNSFKSYAESYAKRGLPRPEDRLQPLRGNLPAADKAWDEFHAAMEDWDAERADRSAVVLVRGRGAHEIAEGLWRYGARDVRQIGHKAIFLANAWRTLGTIGWQHAETVLRALVRSLTANGKNAEFEKQPYLRNVERARNAAPRLPGDWATAQSDPGLTKEVLALLRDGHTDHACRLAVTQLVEGNAHAGSLWDAVHLAAGELIMRERSTGDLGGVHAVTSSNALHYAFRMSGRAETRLLILLQAVGWMGEFRNQMGSAGLKDVRITHLTPGEIAPSEETAARDILAAAGHKPKSADHIASVAGEAAPKAFRYAQQYPEPRAYFREARRQIFLKSSEEHEYKYPAAIFEDYRLVDPQWRPHLLAASVYYVWRSGMPDSPIMLRAREAIGAK